MSNLGIITGYLPKGDTGYMVLGGISIAVVPEPGTLALLASGLAGLLWRKRRD